MKNPVVHFEIATIPKSATFALFADPQGNCVGIVASQIPD